MKTLERFRSNGKVVNPDMCQSIIIIRLRKIKDSYELLIDNHKIVSENSITLLGIEIGNKLNFEKHVTAPCQRAGRQLNALSRIHKYIGFQEMQMLLDSFIFSNFNYCPPCVVFLLCRLVIENRENTRTWFEVIV